MIKIGFLELYSSLVREISMSKLLSEFDLSSDVSLYLHECKSDSLVLDSLLVLISSISIPGRIAVSQSASLAAGRDPTEEHQQRHHTMKVDSYQ